MISTAVEEVSGNSSLILFGRDIKGKKIPFAKLKKRFFKEVDKDDYFENDLNQVLRNLRDITNGTCPE